jgi:hypothetical protein
LEAFLLALYISLGCTTKGGDSSGKPLVVEEEPSCIDVTLEAASLLSVAGENAGLGDDFEPECYDGGYADSTLGPSEDVVYAWTAPASGCWSFDSEGSWYDTLLEVRDGCKGLSLGCNDNSAAEGGLSRLSLELDEGQEVVVIVDSYDGTFGAHQLNISEAAIPGAVDLGSALEQVYTGFTADPSIELAMPAECGGYMVNGVPILWTAPQSGRTLFSTEGSGTDTILNIGSESFCAAGPWCNDDATEETATSAVELEVAGGQTYAIVVGTHTGEAGNWTLSIEFLD